MTIVTNLGFPRMGARRELKQALEAYWRDNSQRPALVETARELRQRHWTLQRDAGAHVVPCNDFSLYDHVLDTAYMFDAIPERYRAMADADALARRLRRSSLNSSGQLACLCIKATGLPRRRRSLPSILRKPTRSEPWGVPSAVSKCGSRTMAKSWSRVHA